MPSLKCYQCGKIKRCKMHLERDRATGATTGIYLCRPCAKDLGYAADSR